MTPGDTIGDISKQADACLNVTLVAVEDLVAKDVSGYSDPYCRLKIEDQMFKSTTKFNTLNTSYDEHFQFLGIRTDQVAAPTALLRCRALHPSDACMSPRCGANKAAHAHDRLDAAEHALVRHSLQPRMTGLGASRV